MWQLSQRMFLGTCKAERAQRMDVGRGGGERRVAEGCRHSAVRVTTETGRRRRRHRGPDRRRRRHASSWWNLSLASGNSRSSRRRNRAAGSSAPELSFGAVWHCSHDWKWLPVAIGNPAGCVTLTACVDTRCSAPFAWQKRQLPFPRRERRRSHSTARLLRPGPIRPACLAFWSAASWQAVQSTFVEAPVVWQLLQPNCPARSLPGLPARERPSRRFGKKT